VDCGTRADDKKRPAGPVPVSVGIQQMWIAGSAEAVSENPLLGQADGKKLDSYGFPDVETDTIPEVGPARAGKVGHPQRGFRILVLFPLVAAGADSRPDPGSHPVWPKSRGSRPQKIHGTRKDSFCGSLEPGVEHQRPWPWMTRGKKQRKAIRETEATCTLPLGQQDSVCLGTAWERPEFRFLENGRPVDLDRGNQRNAGSRASKLLPGCFRVSPGPVHDRASEKEGGFKKTFQFLRGSDPLDPLPVMDRDRPEAHVRSLVEFRFSIRKRRIRPMK